MLTLTQASFSAYQSLCVKVWNALVSSRSLVVLSEALHAAEAHPGLQKCPRLHPGKPFSRKIQPRSEKPAGGAEAALQSQIYASLLLSSVIACFSSFVRTFCSAQICLLCRKILVHGNFSS